MKKILFLFILGFLGTFTISFAMSQEKKPPQKNTGHTIKLLVNRALPADLIINKGDTVQFSAADGKAHSLEQGTGDGYGGDHLHNESSLRSGTFGKDEAWRMKFDKAGTYNFHDHLNPQIYMTIFVYDPRR